MTEAILFSAFSLSAVFFALNVILRRNAVHCALHLVGVLLSLSGLFVLLNAQFIAAIQILVYAGAIMVLFLFVVMLLNVKAEGPLLTPGPAVALPPGFGSPAEIGRILYNTWLFPFEVTSVLLLIAVIGAVVLAKRKFL
jgi:NADH-quinone oxidoreductase subunit J